jgi:molybdopterin synthase catalytic subunit
MATSWRFSRPSPEADVAYATHLPIRVEALIAEVAGPMRGGTAVFLGSVRRSPEDGLVNRIEYSAHEAMLEAEFGRIVAEAVGRWPDVRVAACHRLGAVETGEASMAVAVAAPHRAHALDACRHVVEEAKRRLPIWKREILDDGSASWRDNAGGRVASDAPAGGP